MATILASARPEAGTPGGPTARLPVTIGAVAGALTAAVGLAVLSAVTVLLWATGPQADGRSADPFRTAAAFWVLGHRGVVDFPGTTVQIAPLGMAAVLALLAVRAAGWASRTAQAHDLPSAARVVGGFTLAIAAAAFLASRLTQDHSLHVGFWSALVAVVPFGVVAATAGVVPQTYEWAHFAAPRRKRWAPILRSTVAAALVLFAGGAVVVAASLFARLRETTDLFETTGGGFSGAFGLLLLSIAFLPTAACWAVAYAAGPGFAMGTDASVSLAGVHTGAVPALPIAGALPGPGGVAWYGWLPPVLIVLAGVVAGRVDCSATARLRTKLLRAAVTAALTGVLAAAVLAFSTGDAGGRLETMGPGWSVGPVLVAELTAVALITIAVRHAVGPRPAAVVPAVPTQRVAEESSTPVAVPPPATPAVDVLADDPLRFAGIPSDPEDFEDTVELPVIRLPLLPNPVPAAAVAAEENKENEAGEAEAETETGGETEGETEAEDESGRLRRRWARAKARLAAEAPAPEEISPEAAEAMRVAAAQYSADVTLPISQ